MLLMLLVKHHHPKLFFVLLCHGFFVLKKRKNKYSKEISFYLRLADSIFCRSVFVLSLLIGFLRPRAAHIRRFAVNEVVCGRVLYG